MICYILTSLVSLQQGNVKKSEKSIKILNIEGKKFSYLLNDSRNLNEIFKKDVVYDNIKSHKKAEFHPLPRKYIFGKVTGSVELINLPHTHTHTHTHTLPLPPTTAFLGLNLTNTLKLGLQLLYDLVIFKIKDTVMQIEKALINDRLCVSKVS